MKCDGQLEGIFSKLPGIIFQFLCGSTVEEKVLCCHHKNLLSAGKKWWSLRRNGPVMQSCFFRECNKKELSLSLSSLSHSLLSLSFPDGWWRERVRHSKRRKKTPSTLMVFWRVLGPRKSEKKRPFVVMGFPGHFASDSTDFPNWKKRQNTKRERWWQTERKGGHENPLTYSFLGRKIPCRKTSLKRGFQSGSEISSALRNDDLKARI